VDYTDTLKKQFGKTGWTIGMFCFILNFYVPVLLFFQLLAQNLYPVILVVIYLFTGEEREIDLEPDWSQFSYSWTCVIIFFLTLGLASYRDLQVFVRMSTFGVAAIFVVIVFIIVVGFYALEDTEYTYDQRVDESARQMRDSDANAPYVAYIAPFSSGFPILMGILGGGFYFHNISLPVLKNAKDPKKGVRDIFIGYFLVYLTYISCGSLGYYGFMGKTFQSKTWGVSEDSTTIQF